MSWELAVPSAGTVDVQQDTRTALVYLYPNDDFSANVLLVYDSTGHAAVASITGTPSSGAELSVAPDSPELTFDEEMAVLYAMGGVPPYTWRVVYPARGTIVRYGRDRESIVYKRIEEPDQIIILSDSAGAAIPVTVSQPEESGSGTTGARLSIKVDPMTLEEDGDLAVCTASGGAPPYRWSTSGASGTILGTSIARQIIYQRDMPGEVAITVTDATRHTVTVIVEQPE
jgi:hypothetical protein